MRISDWSSDVCSSDLVAVGIGQCLAAFGLEVQRPSRPETLEDIVRPRACSDQSRLSRGFEIGAAKAERSLKRAILVENPAGLDQRGSRQIGRAACRETVCQYVEFWVVSVSSTKTTS